MKKAALLTLLIVLTPAASGQMPKAPPLVLKDLRGRRHRLSDYRGKVVLLNFWATWCPPCRAEVPDLVRWQREHAGRGLQVIGVTYPPTNRADVRRFIRRFKINYPVLLGARHTRAAFDGGETLPVTVLIDRDGRVRELIEGILLPEEFEEKVKPLLGRGGSESAAPPARAVHARREGGLRITSPPAPKRPRLNAKRYRAATNSISTSAPSGSLAAWMVVRAGSGSCVKKRA
ncbi:MAG: TlpA family protein disulfide reductase [Acidobacteriota bacterium]|nr:TlpA family protein disulfide reductase [Acidobacteriota bacterium]